MSLPVMLSGPSVNLAASGQVTAALKSQPVAILGFYVCSTSSGVIKFTEGGSGGTDKTGSITPAIGWHFLPIATGADLYMTLVSGSINVVIVIQPGA